MKKVAILLALFCMLTVTASAAYIPEDVISENRDGRQLIVKTYMLPPDADPSGLVEEPFEVEGYSYHHLETVKEEQTFEDSKIQTEVVTLETDVDDLAAILEQLDASMEYNKDGYSGVLTLDHTTIQTEAAGYTTKYYTITDTKQFTGLDRNDPSYVPTTTVKNGSTLKLSDISWTVTGTGLADDTLVPTSYTAIFGGSVTGISDRSGAYDGSIQAWLPIKDIVQGVVVTRDKRFVKILELLPVNFYTMSSMDKSAAIEDFAAYLKIAPANLQINVLTQPFDLDGYLKLLRGYLERETNEQCRLMLEESMDYVPQLVEREALTHRFFLSFSYDPSMKAPDHTPEAIAAVLNEKAEVARRYLDRCGVAVLEPEYADNFILELFYKLINKHTSQHLRLPDGVFDMLGMVHGVYDEEALKALDTAAAESAGKKKRKWFSRKEASPLSRLEAGATTIPDLIAPPDIDTHHPDYLLIDGVCHAYLYISGYGYSTVVGKGWLTPLIEAGEGVSLSFYLVKQPREKTVNAIGQTTMINRSRMRDVGDTRQDFEELGDAIGAGLYLKEGMNREGQDFYYMHTLIEVIADDPDTLEQRVTAVETLCVASDMLAKRCEYKHEAAFLSFLPLLISDPDIERKSRRNALTSGVAASFPFASFELSDQKGIFLGLRQTPQWKVPSPRRLPRHGRRGVQRQRQRRPTGLKRNLPAGR